MLRTEDRYAALVGAEAADPLMHHNHDHWSAWFRVGSGSWLKPYLAPVLKEVFIAG